MWIAKLNKPYKEKIKQLNFNFADIKKGETMLVSSPSSIAKYIHKIPKGKKKTVIETVSYTHLTLPTTVIV